MTRNLTIAAVLACFSLPGASHCYGQLRDLFGPATGEAAPDENASRRIAVATPGGTVVVEITDRDVELSLGGPGRSIDLIDKKTGQRVSVDPSAFALVIGGGANRVRLPGDEFTFRRGEKTIATIRRPRASKDAPEPAVADAPRASSSRAAAPGDDVSRAAAPSPRLAETIRPWRELKHEEKVAAVAFAGDANRLISSTYGGMLSFWDVETGRELHRRPGNRRQSDRVNDIAVSGDGRFALLGTGQYKYPQYAVVWDVRNWREHRRLDGHENAITSVALSADGRLGVSASRDGEAVVWDIPSGRSLATFQPPTGDARGVAIDPQKRWGAYVGGGDDPRIRLFDLQTGKEIRVLTGHRGQANDVAFLPDGRLLSGGTDGVRLWNAETGEMLHYLSQDKVVSVASDGKVAAALSFDGSVVFWDLAMGQRRQRIDGDNNFARSIALAPDGKTAAAADGSEVARLWLVPPAGEPPTPVPPSPTPPAAETENVGELIRSAGGHIRGQWRRFPKPGEEPLLDVRFTHPSLTDERLEKLAGVAEIASLQASKGQLTERGWKRLREIPNLQALQLLDSGVDDEALEHISAVAELKSLFLFKPEITDEGLRHLASLSQLRELTIMESKISDEGLAALGELEQLETLTLSRSEVTGAGLKHLHGLPQFRQLTLSQSPVDDEGLRQIGGLKNISVLALSSTEITDEGLPHVASLDRLSVLSLNDTDTTDAGLEHLKELSSLTFLNVSRTAVTNQGLQTLLVLPNLRHLNVRETKVTKDGAEYFKAAVGRECDVTF